MRQQDQAETCFKEGAKLFKFTNGRIIDHRERQSIVLYCKDGTPNGGDGEEGG